MDIVLVFNKKDGGYPKEFKQSNQSFIDGESCFCWKADSAPLWQNYTMNNLPELNGNGLLLINDGLDDSSVSDNRANIFLEIESRILSAISVYVCFHNRTKTSWEIIFNNRKFPLDKSRVESFSNGSHVVWDELYQFYKGNISRTQLIDRVFKSPSHRENINVIYKCLSPQLLPEVEKLISGKSEKVKSKFSELKNAEDGPTGTKYITAFEDFRDELFRPTESENGIEQ